MSPCRSLSSFGGKIRQIDIKLVREIIGTQKIRGIYSSQFIADCSRVVLSKTKKTFHAASIQVIFQMNCLPILFCSLEKPFMRLLYM
jgi:hypothetical protein